MQITLRQKALIGGWRWRHSGAAFVINFVDGELHENPVQIPSPI